MWLITYSQVTCVGHFPFSTDPFLFILSLLCAGKRESPLADKIPQTSLSSGCQLSSGNHCGRWEGGKKRRSRVSLLLLCTPVRIPLAFVHPVLGVAGASYGGQSWGQLLFLVVHSALLTTFQPSPIISFLNPKAWHVFCFCGQTLPHPELTCPSTMSWPYSIPGWLHGGLGKGRSENRHVSDSHFSM